jgi:hypothetical protein
MTVKDIVLSPSLVQEEFLPFEVKISVTGHNRNNYKEKNSHDFWVVK